MTRAFDPHLPLLSGYPPDTGPGPAGAPLTRRQSAVRAQLVAAAMTLFLQKGYDETTITDITSSVGKVRRTFSRYFRSKEEIAFGWMHDQGAAMCALIERAPPDESPVKSLQCAFIELARRHDTDELERIRFLTKLILDTPALHARYQHEYVKWEPEFARLLKLHHPMAAAHSFALAVQVAVVNASFNIALRSWLEDPDRTPLASWVEAAFSAYAEGDLRPQPKAGKGPPRGT